MNKPIRCTTHFHACDCREYQFEKVKRQLEIQTKRVENLKKSNEFYADKASWGSLLNTGELKSRIRYVDWDETCVEDVLAERKFGGKLARSCQAIDQELQKKMEEVK